MTSPIPGSLVERLSAYVSGFTPGRWRWADGNGFNSGTYVMAGDEELCEVFDDGHDQALDALANARLLSLAPHVLPLASALEPFVPVRDIPDDVPDDEHYGLRISARDLRRARCAFNELAEQMERADV